MLHLLSYEINRWTGSLSSNIIRRHLSFAKIWSYDHMNYCRCQLVRDNKGKDFWIGIKNYVSKTLYYKRQPCHSSCGFKVKLPGAVLFWSWGQLMKWNIWIELFRFEKIPLSCVHRRHVMVIQSKLYLKYKNLELLLFQNGLNGFGLWVSLGKGARPEEEGNRLIAKKFN